MPAKKLSHSRLNAFFQLVRRIFLRKSCQLGFHWNYFWLDSEESACWECGKVWKDNRFHFSGKSNLHIKRENNGFELYGRKMADLSPSRRR